MRDPHIVLIHRGVTAERKAAVALAEGGTPSLIFEPSLKSFHTPW